MYLRENRSCFTIHLTDREEEGWGSLIKQGQLDNFHKVTLGIKICYGGARRG